MKIKLVLILFLISISSCSSQEVQIKKGNQIVKKIENFRKKNGYLPSSIKEVGIEETLDGPFFYEKKDSANYMIWFGTTLGEGVYYYSDTKSWDYRLRGIESR